MEDANGPAAVSAGLLWGAATWFAADLPKAAVLLALASGVLVLRFSLRALPLRGMLFAALVGALAHLLAGGSLGREWAPALSAALRLAALYAEGRFVYLVAGPSALGAGVAWLSRPLRLFGLSERDMALMALIVLRLLPEARSVGRRVLLGRRYLGLRLGLREAQQLLTAWIGGILETSAAIAESMLLRGFRDGRRDPERISWQGLLHLGWLPGAAVAIAAWGTVR